MARRYLIPLALFAVLVGFLGFGLTLDPRRVPSALIDQPAPAFALPELAEPEQTFTLGELRGEVVLLNVWASWCRACVDEHPLLVDLAESQGLPIYGLNYKDQRDDALRWLARRGDPYARSGYDRDGRVAIDYGVYGVPETFVIDRRGIIRYKHIGPLDRDSIERIILPLIAEL